MPRLKILRGREIGREFSLADESFLGREESNTCRLQDETASRHHAKVVRLDDAYVLVDLGSNNGTLVNGERIRERFLRNGDQIQIGKTLLVFEGAEEAPQAVTVDLRDPPTARWKLEEELPVEVPHAELPRLRELYEIAAWCNSSRQPRVLLDGLTQTLRRALDADVCVALLDGEEPSVCSKEGGDVRISQSAVDRARTERTAALLTAEALADRQSVAVEEIRSIVCAPLIRGDRGLGALYADLRRGERAFSSDDLAFLNAAAHQAALALDQAQSVVRTVERTEPKTLVGSDPAWTSVLRIVDKAAPSESTVLILGESGTGKELVARALHEQSPRREGPFVAINCGALVETLVESELFGHEKGAFTGATRTRHGKFEAARGGTLFLDEIGEMSPNLQAKLLRVLQERAFYRVGGTAPIVADVRVIAATNRDLVQAVKESKFREDLYYRLSVLTIRVPPLRERRGDLPVLCAHFLQRIRQKMKKPIREITPETMEAMMRYSWPGNVRELENVLERAAILTDGEILSAAVLPPEIRSGPVADDGWPIRIEDAEKLCLQRALAKTEGKKGEASKLLGISWPTLNKRIRDYGLEN